MKVLLLFSILMNISHAAVTGITEGCPEKAQLIASEGDKFVTVNMNGRQETLLSTSGAPFSFQAKDPVTFKNKNLEFQMTSMVMSSLPRLIIKNGGMKHTCRVDLNGTND